MKQISLSRGLFAVVDDADYEWLSRWKWSASTYGYAVRAETISGRGKSRKRKIFWMHREIMQTPPGKDTDHINGNRLDNRRLNLQICSRSQNIAKGRSHVDSSVPHRCISWVVAESKYAVQITRNYKRIFNKKFADLSEAIRERDRFLANL